jgi:hypothetical protein
MLNSLHQALGEHIDSRPSRTTAFAWVDMAGLSHVAQHADILRIIREAGAVSVLQDERPDALLATPWLVPLDDDKAGRSLSKRTCDWALRGPAVTWIISPLPLQDLAARLHRRTEADLPDQHPVLMRCFDPRVLPELVHQLKASQNETFLALGHEWLYLDRSLRLQALPLHAAPGVDMFEAPLQLDEAQFTALLDASEVDQVMPELAREAPLEFLALRADQRASWTRRCLDLAGTWHLERLADKVMVGVLMLKLGEGFHLLPAWAPWMTALQARKVSLLQAIEGATAGVQP